MEKFLQLKGFEEEKVKALKEYEDFLQHDFQSSEKDYQQKIKSVLEELAPYRQKLRDEYLKSLQSQSNDVSRIADAQMEKLSSAEEKVNDYASEIVGMIIR